jgi:hypothetical protein
MNAAATASAQITQFKTGQTARRLEQVFKLYKISMQAAGPQQTAVRTARGLLVVDHNPGIKPSMIQIAVRHQGPPVMQEHAAAV